MKRIALFSIVSLSLSLACSAGNTHFTPPSGQLTYEVKPNNGDMNSPCGTIVDGEPAPGGKTCCIDGTRYETFYADGSQTSGDCTGGGACDTNTCPCHTCPCHTGTCGGVWNPDTLTWQVYSKL